MFVFMYLCVRMYACVHIHRYTYIPTYIHICKHKHRRELVALEWEVGWQKNEDWDTEFIDDAEAAIRALHSAGFQVMPSMYVCMYVSMYVCCYVLDFR